MSGHCGRTGAFHSSHREKSLSRHNYLEGKIDGIGCCCIRRIIAQENGNVRPIDCTLRLVPVILLALHANQIKKVEFIDSFRLVFSAITTLGFCRRICFMAPCWNWKYFVCWWVSDLTLVEK